MEYLGWRYYLTDTGAVVRRLKKHSKIRWKHRLRKLKTEYAVGHVEISKIHESMQSFQNHMSYGNTWRLYYGVMGKYILIKKLNGERKNMRKLYIIGNGFDLAHGIKSNYSDFGDFLEEHHPSFYENLNVAFQNDRRLWSSFEETLPSCGDYIENNGLSMGSEIQDELDYDPMDDMGIGIWLREQYDFIKNLPAVLRDWVEHIPIKCLPIFLPFDTNSMFLTFNYTNTLENVYSIPSGRILHLHGDVSADEELIMGHGSKQSIDYAKQQEAASSDEFCDYAEATYSCMVKYYETTYKDTQSIMARHKSWFELLKDIAEVSVIGLSLGKIDMPYIQKINKMAPGANWILYYYHVDEIVSKRAALVSAGIPERSIVVQSLDVIKL